MGRYFLKENKDPNFILESFLPLKVYPSFFSYTKTTKAVVAFAVISSMTLGVMVIVAHIITFIEHSFIIRWLLPAGFISMMVACFSMVIVLAIEGYDKNQELNYMLGWWSPDFTDSK